MAKNSDVGSKQNKNAANETIEISTGQKIMVQEFAVRNTIGILGLIRKVLKALKGKDFGALEQAGEATAKGITSLVDWASIGAEIVEANYDDVLGLIIVAQVRASESGHTALNREDLNEVLLDDVIMLIQAIYRVNFVEGSLKKYVKKLIPQEEKEQDAAKEPSES